MKFNENLIELRKQKGYSQEELAYQLGVSRQSISKWESGLSIPELERIIELADLFEISIDDLVRDNGYATNNANTINHDELKKAIRSAYDIEYKSKWNILGVPLVHINIGRGKKVAKGILAVGTIAYGLISIGGFSIGLFSFGIISIALIALGPVAIGGLSIGALSIGYVALGGLAIGVYALGGCAIASNVAIGGMAHGEVAIGQSVKGLYTMENYTGLTSREVIPFIEQHANVSGIFQWLMNLFN